MSLCRLCTCMFMGMCAHVIMYLPFPVCMCVFCAHMHICLCILRWGVYVCLYKYISVCFQNYDQVASSSVEFHVTLSRTCSIWGRFCVSWAPPPSAP